MKANFNIEKNVRNSRSISALQALKKLQGQGLVALFLLIGSLQVWGETVPFDLTTNNQITTQTQNSVVFTNGTATITITKSASGTRVDNYMPGGATSAAYTRTYNTNPITFDAGSGNKISSISITATGSSYITQLTGGKWSAETTVTGSEASRTVTLGTAAQSISVTPTGTSRITAITITYSAAASGYTVTIDRNNSSYGTVSAASVTGVTSGTSISASGNVLSVGATNVTATPNSGYKFNNWTGIPGGGTVTENVTVTANFAAVSYTNYRTTCSETYDIVLDKNGGVANGSAKVAANGKQLTSIVAPTRTGYTIEGYYKEAGTNTPIATASGALQKSVDGYTDAGGAWTKGEGATLYTKWTATNYTITYEGLEGAINTNPTNYTIETATIVLANPGIREGYTFAGWTCGGTPITQITVGSTGDKTITATWTPNTYSVRFNKNGGSGSMSNQNFTYGVAQNLTSNSFTHATKSFGGWTTNSDGTGDLYTNGQSVSNLTSTQGAVIDLYAKWVDCDLYTVTLNVNGDTWKTVTQGSCGASIDLSGYQDVPNCGGGYTFVGWSTTNSAAPMFDAPAITKTSSYTPESNVTLYAVYSYSAKIGTKVMNLTDFGGMFKSYILVANGYNVAMYSESDTIRVVKSGNNLVITSSRDPEELYFVDGGSNNWLIYSPYISTLSTYEYKYYYAPSGSGGQLGIYDNWDFDDWSVGETGLYDYDAIETYIKTNYSTTALWTVSINESTGVATISANSRKWLHKTDKTFKTYSSAQSPVALYEYNASGTAYTTQPSMTVYSIAKGAETNGTYTISAGVVCSGGSVSVTATPDPGYAFSGWSSSNGGSFGNASSASTTFTPTANTTVTANFVAETPHDITWMVNGVAYTTGTPTSSMTAGTSFSTMTLPTAPADNTLSSACGAVANTFVGWSTTDMGFATGQSAPQLFTNAAGAGATYGVMGGEDVVFYAVFAKDGNSNYMSRCADTYSITLDKKEGTTNGTAVATEMGSTLDITLAPTYAGHSVEGYYAETGRTTKIANADGSLIANKSGYTDGSGKWINTTSPLTLYTNWTLNSHTLTWNLDGGAISAAGTAAGTVAYGTALVAPTVTKTGYTFNAWSPAVDATMPDNDVTYTATWTAKQYAITYKDKDDAAYSGDKTDGRPTGCPANHTYGSATDLPYGVKAGYRFDGWFTTRACTGDPITSIASNAEGPFTLYAKWTASRTFTFSKNGVVDGTLTLGQVEGGNVIMPNTTVDCGLWTTFEGWVIGDVAETTTEPATIYKPGDIFVAGNSNQEFKAVYSKHEGDASVYYEKVTSGLKSGTYIMVSSEVASNKYVYTGQNSGSGTTDYGTVTTVTEYDGVVTSANLPSGAKEITVRVGRNGSFNNKFAMQIPSTKYLSATDGNYLNSDIASGDVADAYVWKLDNGTDSYGASGKEKTGAAGALRSTEQTTRVIQYNNSRFACYTNSQANYVFLYRERVAGTTYYTTAPVSCEVPTEISVSYNDNKAYAGDQTISGMPSGTTLTFTSYPNFASYTIGSAPTDPTGYHFAGWNTSADGSGDDYTAGSSVTTFGYTETITLYAKWERVYTVTLMDNGAERTRLTQARAGAGVTLPSGNNCTPGSDFTFVGWTESAIQLNADPVRPAAATLHVAGSYTPTSDITLYSVYSRSVAGCEDFAAGKSGAYTIMRASYYAQQTGTDKQFDIATTNTNAAVFYIAYSYAKRGYTIRTKDGYIGWNYEGSDITRTATSPYYWNISGSVENGWKFTPQGVSSKYLSLSTSGKFMMYGTDYGYNTLTSSAMTYYYTTAQCGDSQIKFYVGGGITVSGTPTTPGGASWNSGTHVLSGLENCDKITTFPTASYEGWDFIGWSTEDYSNSGKHSTDYVDENGSTDEPDASSIYNTGKNPYIVMGGSITLYPVFTRMPNSEPFNNEEGGDYVMYYIDENEDDGFGGHPVKFAGPWDGTKRYTSVTNCSNATVFTFTKSGDVWHIQNKENGKYLGGNTGDWLIENNSLGEYTDWTITIRSGNQFNASCQNGRQIGVSGSHFMDYTSYDITHNPGYSCIYLGSCEERIFSSEPNATPILELSGEPIVTSSAGQTVRATTAFTLRGSHLGDANKVTLTGTNLKFATSATATPSESLNVRVTSGNVSATDIYVYYTPTATTDGIENIIVTAIATTSSSVEVKRATASVAARHLPANFVIAAKASNGKWYALPADITGSTSPTNGVLIEVDNNDDPTIATSAPNNAQWGLRNVKATRQTSSGLGHHLTFTERLSTATANDQKTLYNGSTTSIQAYAMWSGYATTNPEQYEWIPTTTDLKDYTLTSAKTFDDDEAARTLSMNTSGVFGTLLLAKAYDGKVRLLPAEFYTNAAAQIVEWKANSVVVMYTGTQTTAKTKVGTNGASDSQALDSHKLTHAVYELTTDQSLTSNDGKKLEIAFGTTEKLIVEIPVIITGTSTASDNHASQDLIILKDAKLTAAADKYSYRNVYVYGGGKLDIPSGTSLGVNNIILRAGGISTDGSGGSATYEYIYPQVKLVGELSSSVPNIKYEYVTDYDHWYHLCLPFDASYTSVSYPQEYYGSNVAADNHGSWVIKRYDGATRATGNYDAWVDIETDWKKEGDPKTVYAGHGYIFWGAPKKVSVGGGAATRQAWGIQRMTMAITSAAAATTAETYDKNISVDSYSNVNNPSNQDNDRGWNLVGNPYMVNLTDLSSNSLIAGKLVHTETNPWDGKWMNNGDGVRYVTIPDNNFDSYVAKTASVASGEGDLMPGRTFFVQIAEGASTLTFDAANRASLTPARFAQTAQSVDIETGIVMSDESKHDEVNFWIKEDKSAEYEYNADYPKTPNKTNFNIYGVHQSGNLSWVAISPAIAESDMAIGYQVPAAGDYTLSLSEKYIAEEIESVFVTDHGVSPELTTDLMVNTYSFTVHQAETNNERFTVSIKVREEDNTPTDIGNSTVDTHAVKFIRDDKMYILRNGLLYDATGKRVNGINK